MGATIALVASVGQTATSFIGNQRQAAAAKAQGEYESNIDNQNASLADAQAQDALQRGQVDESRQRMATRQNIGSSRAALAAQGVDISSGSAADVQASEAGLGELDALTIRNNAAREAWGYTVEGINYRQQGKLAKFGGQQAAAGYTANSYSSLLSGAAQTYGIYQRNSNDRTDMRNTQYRTSTGR
jgi:hypothetical protein